MTRRYTAPVDEVFVVLDRMTVVRTFCYLNRARLWCKENARIAPDGGWQIRRYKLASDDLGADLPTASRPSNRGLVP